MWASTVWDRALRGTECQRPEGLIGVPLLLLLLKRISPSNKLVSSGLATNWNALKGSRC